MQADSETLLRREIPDTSLRRLLRLSGPVVISLMAQNLIGVIDTAFLGRLGVTELGGASIAALVYFSIFTIGFGLASGTQIIISHKYGAGQSRSIGNVLGNSIMMLLGAAILAIVLAMPIGRWAFGTLLTSKAVGAAAMEYWDYRMLGFIFIFISSSMRSFFVGIGETKVLTYNSLVMSVVNIVLDWALIFGNLGLPALGVKGAAIASVCAEGASLIFYLLYIRTRVDLKKYGMDMRDMLRWDGSVARSLLHISYFLMLQALMSQSVWTLFFFMLESLGEMSLGVASISRSVYNVLFIPIISYGTAVRTTTGQLMGADAADEIAPYLHRASRLSLGTAAVLAALVSLFASSVLRVFTDDPALITAAVPSMRVLCLSFVIASVGNMYFHAVGGVGSTQKVFRIELTGNIFYLLYAVAMVYLLRAPIAVCFTVEAIYFGIIAVRSYLFMRSGKWRGVHLV